MKRRAKAAPELRLPRLRPGDGRLVGLEVARTLKTAIAAGQLVPGDRLPAERALAERLGVSRSSLRDALKVLSGLGLLEVRRNQGASTLR